MVINIIIKHTDYKVLGLSFSQNLVYQLVMEFRKIFKKSYEATFSKKMDILDPYTNQIMMN